MIVVDSNVLSELTAPRPAAAVVHWFARFGPVLALPAIVIAELYAGVEMKNDPERKSALGAMYNSLIAGMRDRVLLFDVPAAMEYANLAGASKRAGVILKAVDGQVAAIARVHRAAIATRNVRDFKISGLKLINPWEEK